MKKIILGILLAVASLVLFGGAAGQALVSFVPAEVAPSGVTVSIPDVVVDKSPVLASLKPGSLERVVFIHYANGRVEARAKVSSCYKLLGVKWRTLPVNYVVHPDLEIRVGGAIAASAETW